MKETCPVCGASGKIVGHTTKNFEREEISVERIEEIIAKAGVSFKEKAKAIIEEVNK